MFYWGAISPSQLLCTRFSSGPFQYILYFTSKTNPELYNTFNWNVFQNILEEESVPIRARSLWQSRRGAGTRASFRQFPCLSQQPASWRWVWRVKGSLCAEGKQVAVRHALPRKISERKKTFKGIHNTDTQRFSLKILPQSLPSRRTTESQLHPHWKRQRSPGISTDPCSAPNSGNEETPSQSQ